MTIFVAILIILALLAVCGPGALLQAFFALLAGGE